MCNSCTDKINDNFLSNCQFLLKNKHIFTHLRMKSVCKYFAQLFSVHFRPSCFRCVQYGSFYSTRQCLSEQFRREFYGSE